MQLLTFKKKKSVNNQLLYPFIDYFSFAMFARNGNCLKTKYHSLQMCQFSNNYMGLKIWNLRQLNSLSAFKCNMKKISEEYVVILYILIFMMLVMLSIILLSVFRDSRCYMVYLYCISVKV